jgi:SAM-dependent methyltransferase
MVEHCRSLGLRAEQCDALSLRVEQPVDAAFAMNSFLHIPVATLTDALRHLCSCLRPGGLFYLGLYGGEDREGPREADGYEPKRWFVSHSDERLLGFVTPVFEVIDFHTVDLDAGPDFYFQSLTLQAPSTERT